MDYLASFLAEHDPDWTPAGRHPTRENTRGSGTDKTDKTGSVSFGTSVPPCIFRDLAIREVLALRAGWLPELPASFALVLKVPSVNDHVWVDFRAQSVAGAFDVQEWAALIRGAESERPASSHMAQWVASKRSEAGWRLHDDVATCGRVRFRARGWSTGRVLAHYGVTLRAVLIEGEEK
jgi:hypothetical protein